MRIYPGEYIPRLDCHANHVSVTLDGVKLERVLWADEEEGLVSVACLDAEGRIYLTKSGHVAAKVLSGKVCIHPPS